MRRLHWVTLAATAALLIAIAAGTVVLAQGPGRRGDGMRRFGGPGFGGLGAIELRGLDLSDAQRQQIRDIMSRFRDETAPVVARLREAEDARRKAVEAVPADEGQIRATTEALVSAQTDMAIERSQLRAEVLSVLTPEQQEKEKQLRTEREARMNERRQQFEQRRQERRQQQQRQG